MIDFMKTIPTVRLEMANGETFSLPGYVRGILKTQDMKAWMNDTREFERWLKDQIRGAVENLDVRIY